VTNPKQKFQNVLSARVFLREIYLVKSVGKSMPATIIIRNMVVKMVKRFAIEKKISVPSARAFLLMQNYTVKFVGTYTLPNASLQFHKKVTQIMEVV